MSHLSSRSHRGIKCLALAAASFGLAACSLAPPRALAPAPEAMIEVGDGAFEYQLMTLPNGFRVLTLEDASAPIAEVQVWYHVGCKDETPDRRGFAHMFEHMMFRGTKRLEPEGHFLTIQRMGGDSNAYTSFDQTVYIQTVPADQVETVLWLEAERMAFLTVDDEGFLVERDVVAEEYRESAEQPYGTLADRMLPELFPGGVYSWTPIGDLDDLYAARTHELQDFWEAYYTPNNAMLVVVGDVKHGEVQEMAQRYFGWIPRYPEKPELSVPLAPVNEGPVRIEMQEPNGPAPIIAVGWRTVPESHPDHTPLTMATSILAGGESSRIWRRVVIEEKAAMVAMGVPLALELDGILAFGAVLPVLGGNGEKVLEIIREEIARFIEEGPTEQEMEKVRNSVLFSQVAGQRTVGSMASALGNAAMIQGDVSRVNRQVDEIMALTGDDLVAAMRKYVDFDREIVLDVKPSRLGFLMRQLLGGDGGDVKDDERREQARLMAEADPFTASGKPGLEERRPHWMGDQPPAPRPAQVDLTSPVQYATLDNGIKIGVLSDHRLPFLSIAMRGFTGAYVDHPDARGTASMAFDMVTKGTENYTAEELTEILEFNSISISGGISNDGASFGATSLSHQAEMAVELLAEVVRRPAFPEDELELLISQEKTSKAIDERSPSTMASRELRLRQYPEGHPYRQSASPELAELDAIKAEHLREWYHSNVMPGDFVFYISGDITLDDAVTLVDRHFGDWEGEALFREDPSFPEPGVAPTHIYLVDRRGDQSQIRIAQNLPAEFDLFHPDYAATRIINEFFGSGFASRLMKTVRVELGLTYGIGGSISASRFGSDFRVATFTKTETVPDAIKAILTEIRGLQEIPASETEINDSRASARGSFVLGLETPQAVIGLEWLLERYGLPADYYGDFLERVLAVEPADITRAAQHLIDPDSLIIVVVGPAAELEERLSEIAPVTVVTP